MALSKLILETCVDVGEDMIWNTLLNIHGSRSAKDESRLDPEAVGMNIGEPASETCSLRLIVLSMDPWPVASISMTSTVGSCKPPDTHGPV